ncbi:MAG: DUF1800 family protein, partial [Chloroflexi bacterium]
EQMTLFWHNHFALSDTHVSNASLLCRHIHALRQHALGSFDTLLDAVLNQPALFISTAARANPKARPNENLPRVLLEQFALAGQVSAADLNAAARALTGWFVSNNELHYSAREHDEGPKSFLGKTGAMDKSGLTANLAQHQATAELLVRKLYRWFISETASPSQELLKPMVSDFAADRDIARVVSTMLRSNLFFSPAAYRQKIKSPVEFALSIIRPLNGAVPTTKLATDLADLGQDLYAPPTLHGWAGHRRWINCFTLLGRLRLAQALFATSGPYGGKLDPFRAAAQVGREAHEPGARFLFNLFLQGSPPEQLEKTMPTKDRGSKQIDAGLFRELAAGLVASPEFNLA